MLLFVPAVDVHDILGQDHEVGRAHDLLHHGNVTCGHSGGVGEDSAGATALDDCDVESCDRSRGECGSDDERGA